MKGNTRNTSDLSSTVKLIEKLYPFKQQIYFLVNYTKMELMPLSTEQENTTALQNAKERSQKQKVSSRQKFQDELGYLLISLLQSETDDERERHLNFIEKTIRRYIQFVE